ncbi:phage terminase large subunit family protein [Tengunoibacter tsumagoiensis]|uniref:Terminase large subunit gp17-like C-terminal domain-containing protein n=1 Tax=Tengunoibacter tsumagoiensis TaxID=2014871 RepID=A0A402A2R3_9CHLR|nr:hypothetical protein [Tengunoibacter tsumagoiensis]GCE13301.1 hypothetical protein KTT_31600 [Tengunoibacter tsumagoiensis]
MQRPPLTVAQFAQQILGKPLYPYQELIAEAIVRSIYTEQGHIFTVMMARQSGKNQLSAVLEAYLLFYQSEGVIVKAAPTFRPQILHSRLRLLSLLETPLTRKRIWQSYGQIVGLAPRADQLLVRNQIGPRVMFFSAAPESNVVGATASLLLEIDEAQDVSAEKFDRDFRPMASTTNATTVLYGTAWSDRTLLAQQQARNREFEQRTGIQLHFEYDWRILAAVNSAYRHYVEQEIARLGEEHQAIQTQYYLRPINGADYFLTPMQQKLLQGSHIWEGAPGEGGCYLAGLDIAGEERAAGSIALPVAKQRDWTVLSIGRVRYNELNLPVIEVVYQQRWHGARYLEQYAAISMLIEQWNIRAIVIDGTGLGAGLASLLEDRYSAERVTTFHFTRPSKSRLAYQLLALINSGRLKLYLQASAPFELANECWQQLRRARYRLPAPNVLDMYVDPSEGHDDFLISLALLTEALGSLNAPALSTCIPPLRLYGDEGRF